MSFETNRHQSGVISWKGAIRVSDFRIRLIVGLIILTGIVSFFPYFFQHIEARDGSVLHDMLLEALPNRDCSLTIFICIWSTTAMLLYRSVQDPLLMISFLYSYIIVTLVRLITISLLPLNPPDGLIPLVDPISNIAYGQTDFITKDLFFSGHTSTLFLIYLCLGNRKDKAFAVACTVIVGVMVLIQRVHYTIDVFCAPVFTYGAFWLGKRIALPGSISKPMQ